MSSKDLSDKITEYEPLMVEVCKSVFGFVTQDLMQVCRLAVWDGIKQFDKSKHCKLSTFLYYVIRNNLITTIKKEYTERSKFKKKLLSMDYVILDEEDTLYDLVEDKNVKHPIDIIAEKEMPNIIRKIIDIYMLSQSNRPKCRDTGPKLYDYLVHLKSPTYMRKKWGPKYDNVLLRFGVFMRKYISRNEIKLNVEERIRWDKKSRQIRYKRNQIGWNRGRKYMKGD